MSYEDEPEDRYDRDEDGLIINGEETYREVAHKLWENRVHYVPWTDELGSRYDLWLAFGGEQAGDLANGLNSNTHLMVGILAMGGCFGFDVTNGQWKAPSYIGEKLHLGGDNLTTRKLAHFLNGVIWELMK